MPALVVLLLLTLSGCNNAPPKGDGSILILAVPNMRADDIGCGVSNDSITPQLDKICNESVHFTHAYTPSVLETSGLASVLTGLYPAEHGVHRNSASIYAPNVKSLPQFLSGKGYETIFVSGGVPFLRKVAVSKGFTDFDDSIRSDGSSYRPAGLAVKKFISLLDSRSDESSFLGVITFSDLLFPEVLSLRTTQVDHAEGSHNGKLQDVDEAIGQIRNELKNLKIWDALTVVVVGLVGRPGTEHEGLSKGVNLYDEIVHVPMIIKPQRKPRDLAPSWKVDEPVTLADLGATLMDLSHTNYKKSFLPVKSFADALAGKPFRPEERPLFIESDLPRWRNWGPRMHMLRLGQWVYWINPEAMLFNTYTDRLELRNLANIDYGMLTALKKVWKKYEPLFTADTGPGEHFMPQSIGEKLRSTKPIFSRTSTADERVNALQALELRRPGDWQVLQWHVAVLFENENWPALKELISKKAPANPSQSAELRLWQTFVQLKNRAKVRTDNGASEEFSSCLYMAAALKRFNLNELESLMAQKGCQDQETQYWISAYTYSRSKRLKEAAAFIELAKAATEKRVEQVNFAKAFWMDGADFDFPDVLPGGPAVFDLFVSLASSQDFSAFVKKKPQP